MPKGGSIYRRCGSGKKLLRCIDSTLPQNTRVGRVAFNDDTDFSMAGSRPGERE